MQLYGRDALDCLLFIKHDDTEALGKDLIYIDITNMEKNNNILEIEENLLHTMFNSRLTALYTEDHSSNDEDDQFRSKKSQREGYKKTCPL